MEGGDYTAEFLKSYDEISDAVFRRCYFKVSNREVALDLTQDAFTRVWDYLAAGKEVKNLKAFTFTVANNLIKDYYKKKKSIPISSLHDEDPNDIPDRAGIEDQAEVEQMIRLLDRLDEHDRELILMRYVEDMSPQAIAEHFGERENTISVRIHRARKKLLLLLSS